MTDLFGTPTPPPPPPTLSASDLAPRLFMLLEGGDWFPVAEVLRTFGVTRPVLLRALEILGTWRGVYVDWRQSRTDVRLVFAHHSIKEELYGVQQAAG